MSLAISIDTLVVTGLLVSGALFIFRGTLFGGADSTKHINGMLANGSAARPNGVQRKKRSRNFVEVMEQTDKNVIIFFGSQTGTAEDYANRVAKEAHKRFGLRCMVADIEDYDMERLDRLPADQLAIFVVATYGEGEPTDNATEFWNFLVVDSEDGAPSFSRQDEGDELEDDGQDDLEGRPLRNLHYTVFGLGNRTYEHFNAVARILDARLAKLGAHRVCEHGEGDDDANLEEDYITWKETAWPRIAEMMQVCELTESAHEPAFKVQELEEDAVDAASVHHGELVEHRVSSVSTTLYDIKRPFMARIKTTRELFTPASQRNCIHAEVDLRGSNIRYTAGDHLAVWPVNSEQEVLRIARACGISDSRLDTVIRATSTDDTSAKKYPFPVPTTYRAMFRHYIDINSCPSREFVAVLAQYVTAPEAVAYLQRLGSDKEAYHTEVMEAHLNLAALLEQAGSEIVIPVAIAIEGLGRLQPRYYSISSSPKVDADHAHVTAVVVDYDTTQGRRFNGVATGFLHSVHGRLITDVSDETASARHHLSVQKATGLAEKDNALCVRVPIFVRPYANFKLPRDHSRPIVMVGPGTGVAPFRAFIQERVHLMRSGVEVGRTVLFFGCRNRDHDFLFRDEWDGYFESLAGNGELVLAFSREQEHKVYVQDRLRERQSDIWRWLSDDKGNFYVCGDAKNMARAVNSQMVRMAQECGGLAEEKAVQWVKDLRSQGRYQEDVWS